MVFNELLFVNSLAHGCRMFRRHTCFCWSTNSSRSASHGIWLQFQGSLIGKELALGLLHHQVVNKSERDHRLYHGDGPWQYAGIVTSFAPELHLLTIAGYSSLYQRRKQS